jgi:hypothetical protein
MFLSLGGVRVGEAPPVASTNTLSVSIMNFEERGHQFRALHYGVLTYQHY